MNRKRLSVTHGPAAGRRLAERRTGQYLPLSDAARGQVRRRARWYLAWRVVWPDCPTALPQVAEATARHFAREGPATPCPPLE